MDISLSILGILFLAACCAGFIDAMAGGGGLITLPALLAAGVPPTSALATNKLQSSFGSFSASLYFVRTRMVSLKEMRLSILCTFIGAAIGSLLVQRINVSILTSLIPFLLICISLYFLLSPTGQLKKNQDPLLGETVFSLCIGTGIGFYDGFFGPGTGSLFAAAFMILARLSIVEATARTKILNFTSNLAALIFFVLAGLAIWKIGLTMAVGQFLGARLGAKTVIAKGQSWIRPLVIIMCMLMAAKLLWQQHQNLIQNILSSL